MIRRSTGPLVVAYLLLVAAGVFFLQAPALSLAEETEYNALVKIWSSFYIAGGVFAAVSAVSRLISRRLVSFWYFEVGGLMLLISANLVYGYALFRSGIIYNEFNVLALSLVIFAFTGSLIARTKDAYRYAKVLTQLGEQAKLDNEQKRD